MVVFTAVHPLALVASALWVKLRGQARGEGAIRLPADENGHGAAPGGQGQGQARGPREVDAEALWG